MNIKEGIKRIFLAIGYIFFALCGLITTNGQDDYIISVFGVVLGFYTFKGLLFGISWVLEGFKE